MVSMLVDMSWKKSTRLSFDPPFSLSALTRPLFADITSLYILKDDIDLLRRWYTCVVRGACAGAHQYAAFLESGELIGCVTGYAPGVEFMGECVCLLLCLLS